jgi:hypothetical protein
MKEPEFHWTAEYDKDVLDTLKAVFAKSYPLEVRWLWAKRPSALEVHVRGWRLLLVCGNRKALRRIPDQTLIDMVKLRYGL